MTGRRTDEPHRASTPLELLLDLTFVVGFGQVAAQTGRLLADGHSFPALEGFSFRMLAVCWAWINFSWFSSAFDTDDWFFRVTTMIQMIGVLVLALGLPAMFTSLARETGIDNSVMGAGYGDRRRVRDRGTRTDICGTERWRHAEARASHRGAIRSPHDHRAR
jgi:hypothetical protein